MIIGFQDLKSRLPKDKIIILDLLQECGSTPCDVPTYPSSLISAAQGGIFTDLNLSGLTNGEEGYASKKGIFAPANVGWRADRVRKWLFDREEQEIVGELIFRIGLTIVVSHGDFLRALTGWPDSKAVKSL